MIVLSSVIEKYELVTLNKMINEEEIEMSVIKPREQSLCWYRKGTLKAYSHVYVKDLSLIFGSRSVKMYVSIYYLSKDHVFKNDLIALLWELLGEFSLYESVHS